MKESTSTNEPRSSGVATDFSVRAERKDTWDKVRILGAVAVPFVVALLGWFLSSTLKSREVDAEYVNLAIQVLQSQDTAEVGSQLRLWAGEILNELGPVPMPTGLREAISRGVVSLPRSDPSGVARLEIRFDTDMFVTLDNVRGMGPGYSKWITRVSPGIHEIVWLTSDSVRICSYQRAFGPDENVSLGCDRQTGVVSAENGRLPN